jgi:hypothetical protein
MYLMKFSKCVSYILLEKDQMIIYDKIDQLRLGR